MSRIVLHSELTLADVRAHLAELRLDEEQIVSAELERLCLDSEGADRDLVRVLTSDDEPEDEGPGSWRTVWDRVGAFGGGSLYEQHATVTSGDDVYFAGLPVLPLVVDVNHRPWDHRRMPRPGDVTSAHDLADDVVRKLETTIAGPLLGWSWGDDWVRGALEVLARTLYLCLRSHHAQRSPRGASHRVVRADVYEAAVESLGLTDHFGTIRRVLEVHHPDYDASLGSLVMTYRGYRDQWLVLADAPGMPASANHIVLSS
jgi:hypothetical protein